MTPEQRRNLIKLRNGLVDFLPSHECLFTMARYGFAQEATPEMPCQTAACAVGMGPSCGIPMTQEELNVKGTEPTWEPYSYRAFVPHEDIHTWDFLFHPSWAEYHTSGYTQLEEAIARLTLVITGKMPEWDKDAGTWDYSDSFANDLQDLSADEIKAML